MTDSFYLDQNMWWKDMKMRIIIGVAIIVLLIIIIVPIVNHFKSNDDKKA